MKVGVVDIGTNSMRLLVTDGTREDGRWVEVTGLGRGVDESRALSDVAIRDTIRALERFGSLMDQAGAKRRKAIATSAARDASNRETFFDLAENALGVRPTLISGEVEARLAFDGTVSAFNVGGDAVVSDIGGGSTEFVGEDWSTSVDIGSVRLTDRVLRDRPAPPDQLVQASELVDELFRGIGRSAGTVIGVAGSWTSLAAIAQNLDSYQSARIHGYRLSRFRLDSLVDELAVLSLKETAAIPSLEPKRAPVMLSGAVVAAGVLKALDTEEILISERDTLDGVANELLALP